MRDESNPSKSAFFKATRLTPSGRAAVATIGVSGARATELFARAWSRRDGGRSALFDEWTPEVAAKPWFGLFRLDAIGGAPEEVVVRRRRPDAFEISGHGGELVSSRILKYFLDAGAELVDADAWESELEDADVASTLDALFYRAADALVTRATTDRTAKIACDQRPAWRAMFRRLRELFESARAAADRDGALLREIETEIDRVLTRVLNDRDWGRRIYEPFRVALWGAPNVGKSRLVNALLGYERANVSSTSGATRDLIAASRVIDGWNFTFIDAAGVRETDDPLEREGIRRSKMSAASADLVLRVYDPTRSRAEQDAAFSIPRDENSILDVLNKIDLLDAPDALPQWRAFDGARVSAKTGEGIDALLDAAFVATVGRFFPRDYDASEEKECIWTDDQRSFLSQLRSARRERDFERALSLLGQ